MSLKICAISDLHGDFPEIKPCDLVLICGDISPLEIQFKKDKMTNWLLDIFKPWCESLPCDKVIFIAGNHDARLESKYNQIKKFFPNEEKVTYLMNELYEWKGLKIFGTPYCKIFGNWPFMRTSWDLKEKFNKIPSNIDILMTHDAPYGTSDILLQQEWYTGEHIGNYELRDVIINKSPIRVCHGHLHSTSHEWEQLNNSLVINCSIKDEKYQISYDPIYFEIL